MGVTRCHWAPTNPNVPRTDGPSLGRAVPRHTADRRRDLVPVPANHLSKAALRWDGKCEFNSVRPITAVRYSRSATTAACVWASDRGHGNSHHTSYRFCSIPVAGPDNQPSLSYQRTEPTRCLGATPVATARDFCAFLRSGRRPLTRPRYRIGQSSNALGPGTADTPAQKSRGEASEDSRPLEAEQKCSTLCCSGRIRAKLPGGHLGPARPQEQPPADPIK
jgi:hypothetical protein